MVGRCRPPGARRRCDSGYSPSRCWWQRQDRPSIGLRRRRGSCRVRRPGIHCGPHIQDSVGEKNCPAFRAGIPQLEPGRGSNGERPARGIDVLSAVHGNRARGGERPPCVSGAGGTPGAVGRPLPPGPRRRHRPPPRRNPTRCVARPSALSSLNRTIFPADGRKWSSVHRQRRHQIASGRMIKLSMLTTFPYPPVVRSRTRCRPDGSHPPCTSDC